jgi:hypothetical protein
MNFSALPMTRFIAGPALLAAVILTAGSPISAQEKLVAPVYPGAIRLSPAKVQNMEPVVFAVPDDHSKVAAFYIPKYGRPADEYEAGQTSSNLTSIVCVDLPAVRKLILAAKGDITLERPALVSIEWVAGSYGGANAVVQVFSELESQAKKFKAHQAELPALKAKYEFLQTAYFLTGKDAEVLSKYGRLSGSVMGASNDPKAMNAYAEEMKKLMAEGKYDQLESLGTKYFGDQKAAEKLRKADHFAEWAKALDELASVSYRTKLSIDVHPSQWDVSWEKKR